MIRVALAQLNLIVGDVRGNVARILEATERADDAGAQILALPELAITGYPPEDLVLRRTFLEATRDALHEVAAAAGVLVVVVGFVEEDRARLYNAAAVCSRGEVVAVYRKHLLPNYGVFDERRYFDEGSDHVILGAPEAQIGVTICEDIWDDDGPVIAQGRAGAQLSININASPFHKGKVSEREEMLAARARASGSTIVYLNLVGGQDELVFDGASLVMSPEGRVVSRLPQFQEAFEVVDVPLGTPAAGEPGAPVRRAEVELRPARPSRPPRVEATRSGPAEVYEALRVGVGDYVRKNGFEKVLLGLSGGIDSALTATIAADAVGPQNVLSVTMPSGFSSPHSLDDSKQLASNLGISYRTIPISDVYETYLATLEGEFGPTEMGLAEENLQARIRGAILMTISNRYGHLVLATGNKSEMAVGYSTLYGDMVGGFAPLKDVFKLEVYELARYRNKETPVIPETILTKPPSAELRPDQRDSDSLPPYDVLDPILEAYIERDEGLQRIAARHPDSRVVGDVIRLVDLAEYKRRQAAPGPKVTTKAFGRDRRLPITTNWREPLD